MGLWASDVVFVDFQYFLVWIAPRAGEKRGQEALSAVIKMVHWAHAFKEAQPNK